ncbi:MAG: type II toxin-antitoxin system HicB family antitoxin [bacterium]|nr:type II toxin-antitoxin system HicB family antitoxin [bacterium]
MGRTYPATVAPDSGGYFAQHPDLPGCMTEGRTEAEALENLEAARELWIETRLENGYSVPEPAV